MLLIRINSNNTAHIFTHCKWWKIGHVCSLYTMYTYIQPNLEVDSVWEGTCSAGSAIDSAISAMLMR